MRGPPNPLSGQKTGPSDDPFKSKVNRLNGEIRVVSGRVEALEKQLRAERDVRKRLRQRLRMLCKHYSDKGFKDRIRAGTAAFLADPVRTEAHRARISAAMTTFLAELTPEQRRGYQKLIRNGVSRLVAHATVTAP
jgi:hypothetical protein